MFKAGDSWASHFPQGGWRFGSFSIFKTLLDPASPQIRAVNTARTAVLPEETVVHKHSHTDTALGTYRNDNTGIVSPPPPNPQQIPGSSQGITVYPSPSFGEEKRFKSLFALSVLNGATGMWEMYLAKGGQGDCKQVYCLEASKNTPTPPLSSRHAVDKCFIVPLHWGDISVIWLRINQEYCPPPPLSVRLKKKKMFKFKILFFFSQYDL